MRDTERIVAVDYQAVSALGFGLDTNKEGLRENRKVVRPHELREEDRRMMGGMENTVSAPMNREDIDSRVNKLVDKKAQRRLHITAKTALCLIDDILPDFLRESGTLLRETAIYMGTGIGGADRIGGCHEILAHGRGELSPFDILHILPERVASVPGRYFGINGPIKSVNAACASANAAMIDAARLLKSGDAKFVISGGLDDQINPVGLGMFDALGALAHGDEQDSYPFDTRAKGFVMGAGGAAVLMTTLDTAWQYNLTPKAELISYAETSDAYHDTLPSGEGAERAMVRAVEQARRNGFEIGKEDLYVCAHATSTGGDGVELTAIRNALSRETIAGISSMKGTVGHLLGGAAAYEGVMALECLRAQFIPGTRNLEQTIKEAKGLPIVSKSTSTNAQYVLNNAFGFGGINSVTLWRIGEDVDMIDYTTLLEEAQISTLLNDEKGLMADRA